MLKKAKFSLIKDDKEEIKEDIKIIDNNNDYSFKIANNKIILNERLFELENEEYKLKIDLIEKTSFIHLKEHQLDYDKKEKKIEYNKNDNRVEFIYKLETDDSENLIIIEKGE